MRKYLFFLFLTGGLSAVAQTPLNTSNGVKTLGSEYTGDLNTNQNWGGTGMNGMYLFNAQTNSNVPSTYPGNWFHVIEMQHDNSNNWTGQIALGYFTDGLYYRQQHDGNVWGNWHTVATQDWNKSNFLSQSGPALIKYASSSEYIIQHQDLNGNMIFGFKRGTAIDENDLLMRSWAGFGFATANSENIKMRIDASGRVGIGVAQPSALLHVNGAGTSKDATNQYNGDFIIQGNTGNRSITQGAQLEFVIPANTDGSNPWGQGRILTVAGNGNSSDATGKMILGTRRSFSKTGGNPTWNYGDDIVIDGGGNVGIGTIDPKGYKLAVNGIVRTQEVQVETNNWPDYVFTPEHQRPSLEILEKQIKEQGHLPNIPSANEVNKNGIALGEMNKKLLEKIEELTLYMIEMKKENTELKQRIEKLENKK